MTKTREAALHEIRSYALRATPHLVAQGLDAGHGFDAGRPEQLRDIDFWAALADRETVATLFDGLGAIRLSRVSRRVWANHDVFLVPCSDGSLLIDVKFGDLKVGALTLLGEADLLASLDEENRFTGMAQITDLLLRRMARGKPVDNARLDAARLAWQCMTADERRAAGDGLLDRFGEREAEGIIDLLEGREPPIAVDRTLRMQVLGSYFSSFAAVWMTVSRSVVVAIGWLTRRPRPFGQYQAGTLTVISGTDGTGKSTTLDNVASALREHGLRCRTVYLGRGRGNVPGVASLRDAVARKVTKDSSEDGVYRVTWLNKAGSWLYAFEYFIRTLGVRFFAGLLGYAILCDRYCYDIALIPGGSAWAIRFARLLCPRPDINVVLHAPPDVILERKAERSLAAIEKQQATLTQIIDRAYARRNSILVDTSKTGIEETREQIVQPILQVSHRDYM
jgi:thymidylate kinase